MGTEHLAGGNAAMEQDQRHPVAVDFVVQIQTIHRRVAGSETLVCHCLSFQDRALPQPVQHEPDV
ncbi:MAG TPA: hypothetical protein VFS21_00245 [Roseiflexaceae bacterium]|nr:hypothetical protein [Roseiflexaceae bacterium]